MRIIFAGSSSFSVPFLTALQAEHEVCLVICKPDKLQGRGLKLTASPVKQVALQNKLPILQPVTLNEPRVIQQVAELKPEVLVDVACGLLVPQAILTVPKYGCLNVHPSLLPRWRGAAPIQHALLAGDRETGVSIMQLDSGLDTGGVITQAPLAITAADTTASLLPKLAFLGQTLLLATLAQGEFNAVPQDGNLATYAHKITKEQGLIAWRQPAITIERMVRAFNPWPGAYTRLANMTIRLGEAQVILDQVPLEPGTIITAQKTGILVATGAGQLRITKMQLPGGRMLAVSELLNAYAKLFTPGQCYGS